LRQFRTSIAVVAFAAAAIACNGSATPSSSVGAPATAVPERPTPEATANLTERVGEVLDAAVTTLNAETVRLQQTLEFQGSTVIPDGTSGSATGQASLGEPAQLRVDADFTDLGIGNLTMIRDGSLVYMRGTVVQRMIGARRWLLVDLESDDPAAAPFKALASGQNDVSMAIYYLYGATEVVSIASGETIDGQVTRRFRMAVDLESARERVPEERLDALEDVIAALRTSGIERRLDAEAWIGEDGLIHRLRYVYQLGPTQGGGTMETVIDLGGFGEPLDLRIPADDKVVPVEEAV
jgi:hypothetical protein